MSKLLPTLFLIIILVLVSGVAYLSFTDVAVEQTPVSNSVTLEQFKSNSTL